MQELEYEVFTDGSLVNKVSIKNIKPCIATEGKVRVLMQLDASLDAILKHMVKRYPPGKVNFVEKKKILTLSIYHRLITLYPSGKVTMNKTLDKEDAVETITKIMETINQVYDDLSTMTQEEEVDLSKIGPMDLYNCLPQSNCEECGETTCLAFAFKILSGDQELKNCLPLQEPWNQKYVKCLGNLLGDSMMQTMGWNGY
ncbi:(Fe-S)-binding protein [Methanobacterium alcaliphilum]|uniref:(Fe-S)-binding protein n=1 Tax=Methanobacterium alcaliphilum TaxID=392018 RepID=UPI00200A6209|nr:(Fe-S)-binding protein [Methanobacterium alcaliphilum]MCK9151085.1 hypothetical protein [Methanobacterium alcaliphilum]